MINLWGNVRKYDFRRKTLPGLIACAALLLGGTTARANAQEAAHTAAAGAQAASPAAASKDIVGSWQGTLHFPATGQRPETNLRLVIKVARNDKEELNAKWYSIDQGAQGIPMATVTFQDGVFKFKSAVVERTYEGKMAEDGKSITGTWMEGTQPIVLLLDRATEDTAWAIPEAPKPMAADANPGFEVATIKPSKPGTHGKGIGFDGHKFIMRNVSLDDMIAFAYGLHTKQIVGAQDWFDKDLFDVDGTPDVPGVPNLHQMEGMMKKLLPDRFGLKFHYEQRKLPAYIITIASGEPKITKTKFGPNDPQGFGFRGFGDLIVANMTIKEFATWFQGSVMDRPVVDHTGLTDRYDFKLKWTPDESQFAQWRTSEGPIPAPSDSADAPPSLWTAMQEQLGLKMEAGQAMDDVMVIDHVDHPSPN